MLLEVAAVKTEELDVDPQGLSLGIDGDGEAMDMLFCEVILFLASLLGYTELRFRLEFQ